MSRKRLSLLSSLSLASFVILTSGLFDSVVCPAAESITIVEPQKAELPERLAAREIRRYLYLRTGELVPIVAADNERSAGRSIIIGHKDQPIINSMVKGAGRLAASVKSLQPQQYLLKTIPLGSSDGKPVLLVVGGDAVGTLYGAYRFAEQLGVRFYLHGDVVPDKKIGLTLPALDLRGEPLFQTRGIQPFHDFPEGPDWWNTDDYKAIIAQLPKLRMNFIGLHTYPQGGVGPEPTVWIGLKEDVNEDGTVQLSSPSSYMNTLRGNWGYAAKKTSDFSFGTAQLFERDDLRPGGDVRGDAGVQDARRKERGLQSDGADAQGGLYVCPPPRRPDLRRHGDAADDPQRRQGTPQQPGQGPQRSWPSCARCTKACSSESRGPIRSTTTGSGRPNPGRGAIPRTGRSRPRWTI